jgi:membrane protease YdiL (CAAX protease family)
MSALSYSMSASRAQRRSRIVWLALALPPLLFLILIVAASIYFGAGGLTDPALIAAEVQQATPWLLVIAQVVLLAGVVLALRADGLTWRTAGWALAPGQTIWREAALGAVPGLLLGWLYVWALAPWQTWLQQTFGDYVPAGETLATVGASVLPFFIANVILAPFVEESLYRGYAFTALRRRYGLPLTFALLALFFGLLHWAGGFWYILLTGLVAGSLFSGLRAWRGGLPAAFAAHLALNLAEFTLIWLAVS